MSPLPMFQQQYTGVVQRETEGRATDSLAIVLWRGTIAAVEQSQSEQVEYVFHDRKHPVFVLDAIPRCLTRST
jgi:hypothetical protein